MTNLFALIVAAVELHWGFFIAGIGVVIVFGLAMRNVRCPRCGQAVIKRQTQAFGVKWSHYGSFGIPTRCANCGLSFVEDRGTPNRTIA
jgi:ribosomal protein S27E